MTARAALIACLAIALSTAASGRAAAYPRPADHVAGPHVRGLDASARSLILEAAASSTTVASLMTALDASDVIVLVAVAFRFDSFAADTRFITTSGGARLLSIRIDKLRGRREQIALLGHELQHALEIAREPGARSAADMRRLMERIGRASGKRGALETDAAIAAERRVAHELLAARR